MQCEPLPPTPFPASGDGGRYRDGASPHALLGAERGARYHMVGKLFIDTWFTSLIDLCEIASRYVLAKAKMIGFVGVCRNSVGQITKTVTVAQLPEHHDEQLVPACEMLHVFVSFVFHYNSIKDSLWQELYELGEDIFSGVHRMTDLLLN